METSNATPMRIEWNDKLTIRGIAYKLRERLNIGHVLARVNDPEVTEAFSHAELERASRRSDFRFERNALSPGLQIAKLYAGTDGIALLPEQEQEEILWRSELCESFRRRRLVGAASLSDASLKLVLPQLCEQVYETQCHRTAKRDENDKIVPLRLGETLPSKRVPPSPRSFRIMYKRWTDGDHNPLALRKRHHRSGDRLTIRIGREERAHLHEAMQTYIVDQRTSIRGCHEKMKSEIVLLNEARKLSGEPQLRVPSYECLAREIRSLNAFEVHASRFGPDAARKKYAIAGNGPDVERPLQRVEIDEWTANLMVYCQFAGVFEKLSDDLQAKVEKARPLVCVIQDSATRVVLGMKIGFSASSDLAMDTIEMAVSSKAMYAAAAGVLSGDDFYGTPERFVHDQGKSFLSVRVRRSFVDLGSEGYAPPAGFPSMRGKIERLFKTAGMRALDPFTGKTFESVVAKGDYDPKGRVSLTLDELCVALTRWVLDIYHNTEHGGLNRETPANRWKRLVKKFGIIPPPDKHTRRHVFGVEVERSLSKRGIWMLGLPFNCLELQDYRRKVGDKSVDVKLDPMDLGHVSVRLGDQGWLAVPCLRAGFDDVPMSVWLAAAADLRRQFKAEAKLSELIVAKAVKAAWDLSEAASRRSILSTRPTSQQVDHDEKMLGIGFELPDPDAGMKGAQTAALFDDLIPTGSPFEPTSESPPAADPSPANPTKFKFEE